MLHESPDEPHYQLALANTLLNTAGLLSNWAHADELEPLYRRIVELDRAAVRTAPDDPSFNAELALALGDQGTFFLDAGRGAQAEAAVREAVEIHEKVLAGGQLKGSVERYAVRNFVNLGRILVAAGQAREAEQWYRKAVNLLDQSVEELPESVYPRMDLARTLPHLADLLKHLGRWQEAARYPPSCDPRLRDAQGQVCRGHGTPAQPGPELPGAGSSALRGSAGRPKRPSLIARLSNWKGTTPTVNNDLAWFLVTSPEPCLRDAARALRLAQKAVTARPESANYRNTLGVAYYRSGDDRAAVAELEKAMSLQAGGTPFDWFFLAMAHWRLGDRDKARMFFDRSVEWMDGRKSQDDELCRIRAEAQAILADPGQR